jgi:SPW repeat
MSSETSRDAPRTPGTSDESARIRGTTMHRDSDIASQDMSAHPDVAEMNYRYSRMLEGPRVSALESLILLAGIYAVVSSFVVHFQTTNTVMAANNIVVGFALAAIGYGMVVRPERVLQLGWVVTGLGAWLVIAPWVASVGHNAAYPVIYNNAFIGGATVLLGVAAVSVRALRPGSTVRRHIHERTRT